MTKEVLIAFDQLANVLFFWWLPGGCWADETISARAWRIRKDAPWLYRVIDGLFFWSSNHCLQSYRSEQLRKQLPNEYRPL